MATTRLAQIGFGVRPYLGFVAKAEDAGIWTKQTPGATSWSDASAGATIWTDDTPGSTGWSDA